MILSNKSTKRFEKLYTSFIAYANDRLSITDNLFGRYGKLNADASYDVARKVFDTGRDDSVMADYLRDNPDKLSRTDLREIAQFEHAIAGAFIVTREGRDVLFFVPGYQIAVRGLTCEVDSLIKAGVPALAETVLLPFENTIVFALAIQSYTGAFKRKDPELFEALGVSNRIIRSARDLIRHEEDIKRSVELSASVFFDDDEDDDDLSDDRRADEQMKGQHRGVLAGLRGKERILAKEARRKELEGGLGTTEFDLLLRTSYTEEPVTKIRDLYLANDVERIATIGHARGLEFDARSMGKEDLIDFLLPDIIPTTEEILGMLRTRGLKQLMFAREIREAGGTLEITRQQASKRDYLAPEASPLYFYRATDNSIVASMMDEIYANLADVDWDAEIERARRLADARHFFETLAALRGVDVFDEAYQEYLAHVGTDKAADEDDILGILGYEEAPVIIDSFTCDIDGTTMLVCSYLMDMDKHKPQERSIRGIIQMQQGKPKRPLTPDMLEVDYLSTWVEQEVTEVQDLIGYLDERVPFTEYNLGFANDLSESILFAAQLPDATFGDYKACMRRSNFHPSKAQLKRLKKLIVGAADHQPSWINRGWSVADMREMIGRDGWTIQNQ